MKPSSREKYFKKIIFISAGLIVILALLVIAFFIYMSNTSSKGTVSQPKSRFTETKQEKPLTLKAQHFSLSYPQTYANATTQQRDKNAIEQYQFTASTVHDKRLAITVVKIPEGINENSAYKYRQLHADLFTESQLKVDGNTAHLMAKSDKKEQALFIPKGGLMTIIVLVTDGAEDLKPEIEAIAKGYRWNL